MINIGEGWFLFVCIHGHWVLYLLGDSGLHVNFQIIILARPNDVLWSDKRSGNEALFITASRQTLRGIAPPGKVKGTTKRKESRINRVPTPSNLDRNYQGHATLISKRRKNLKGNNSSN